MLLAHATLRSKHYFPFLMLYALALAALLTNVLMSVVGLVETSTGAPAPETSLESSSGKLLSLGVNGVEVAIMLSGLERVRGPTSKTS